MAERNRKLLRDMDVSTLRQMRMEGMTNKQIATSLGVSVSTVYNYIGRMSEDVKYAEVQRKPAPVRFFQEAAIDEFAPVVALAQPQEEDEMQQTRTPTPYEPPQPRPKTSMLQIVSAKYELNGQICRYQVNTGAKTVELMDGSKGGIVTGLLDTTTLPLFIAELQEIAEIIGREE